MAIQLHEEEGEEASYSLFCGLEYEFRTLAQPPRDVKIDRVGLAWLFASSFV